MSTSGVNPESNAGQPVNIELTPEQRAQLVKAKEMYELSHGLSGNKEEAEKLGFTYIREPDTGVIQDDPPMSKLVGFLHAVGNKATEVLSGAIKIATLPIAILTSCSKDTVINQDFSLQLNWSDLEAAKYTVNWLNSDKNDKYPRETEDGVEYLYGFDDMGNGHARPYIIMTGENGENLKFYVNCDPLTEQIKPKDVISYINNFIENDLARPKNLDGIGFKFGVDKKGEAVVQLDNGFTHTVGEDLKLDPNGSLSALYNLLESVSLVNRENKSELVTGFATDNGSYANKDVPGFSMQIVTPANLEDVTHGNPRIKGNIDDLEFEGIVQKNEDGSVTVKCDDGRQIRFAAETDVNIGSEDNPDVYDSGLVVYVNGKDTYFMTEFYDEDEDYRATDIGKIDHSEYGTTLQNYVKSDMTTFNPEEVQAADDYYYEKDENLKESLITADKNFGEIYNAFEAHVGVDEEIIVTNP